MFNFTAQVVETSKSEGVSVLGFADSESLQKSIILQYQDSLPEEERALGWSRYYLEIHPPGFGDYKCIKTLFLTPGVLHIVLNDRGMSSLRHNEIVVHYADESKHGMIYDWIQKTFSDEEEVDVRLR